MSYRIAPLIEASRYATRRLQVRQFAYDYIHNNFITSDSVHLNHQPRYQYRVKISNLTLTETKGYVQVSVFPCSPIEKVGICIFQHS